VTALMLFLLIQRYTAALRAGEQQLHRVIDALPVLISYVDADGHYEFSNEAYKEWFGHKAEGKHLEEVLGAAAYKRISKYVDRALKGETITYETELPYQDGGTRFVNATYVPDVGTTGQVKGFFALVQDITERKQAQEELRLWADAFEGCAHGIAVGDPDTNRIVVCNPAFAAMHKCRVEEIVGSAIVSLYARADQEHVRRSIEKADQIGHASYEAHMIRKDGSIFPVQMDVVSVLGEDGELLHRVATAQDISERKQADQKIIQQAHLLERVNDAVIATDENFVIVSWNPAAERIYGWQAEEVIGRKAEDVLKTEFFSKPRSEVVQEIKDTGRFSADVAQARKDDSRVQIEARTVAIHNERGQVTGYVSINRDTTERKKADEEINSLARFPDENPNLVLRATEAGKIIYANAASESLLNYWKCQVGDKLPPDWVKLISELVGAGSRKIMDVQCGDITYSIMIVAVPDANYVNLYGTDITERKQAEIALRKSQAQMVGIVNSAMDAIISTDAEQRILIFNPAAEAMFRCGQSEAIGQPLDRFIPERFREAHRKHIHNFGQTGITSRAMRGSATVLARRNDGEEFPSEASISQTDIAGKKIYTIILRDITERQRAEEVQQLERARWQGIVEGIADEVWMCDAQGKMSLLNLESVTAMGLDIFKDRSVEEVYQEVEIFYPDGQPRPPEQAPLLRSLHGEVVRGEEIMRHRQTGKSRYRQFSSAPTRDANGAITGAVAIVRDITEQKAAEEGLRRFELLSEHSRDIILFMRRADGRILEANAAAIQAYGYSRDELLQLTVQDLRASGTRDLTSEQMAQADAGGILFETIHQRKDGSAFPVEVSSQGATIGGMRTLISIIRDITERKRAEEQLERSNQKLNEILTSIQDDFYVLDRNWNFVYASRLFTSKVGKEPEDFVGKNIWQMFPKHLGTALEENFRAAMEKRETRRFEIGGKYTAARYRMTAFPSAEGITVIGTDITERKQAEEALRASEERYRAVVESAMDAIIVTDPSSRGKILSANPAACRMFGYSMQEFLGLGREDILDVNDPKLTVLLEEREQRGRATAELTYKRKDGTRFSGELSIAYFQDKNGEHRSVAIIRDISERKRAQQDLVESEEKYRLLAENSNDWIYWIKPNRSFQYISPSCERVTGFSPSEFMKDPDLFINIIHPEDRERVEAHLREVRKGSEVHNLDYRIFTKTNQVRWISHSCDPVYAADGKYMGRNGTNRDITERKQVEEALQKAHEELELKVQERTAALSQANSLLQALMDTMPDQIYFKDTQGRFIRNSRSQANLLGLNDPIVAVGKTDFDFFPHAAKSYAEEQEVMKSGKPLVDLEEWVVWPDGTETWVSTTKVPLRNSNGETIGIFGISRDITERKRTEQAIRQLNADLEKQADQLQAANKELEAFSYSVSHDLRAPLRAIDGYTRILVEDYEATLDDEGRRVCGIISAEARRMGQLIDDLLAFSRLGRKQMYASKIDMNALAVSVFSELMKEEKRERIDFQIAKLHPIKGDASLIRQVWINLLSNAIKFSSKKERAIIEVGNKQTPEENIYYVRDNGAGFDMEYANKLFGVFQRLHSESEFDGTGVGLAIVQRIIRRHGGRVWAQGEMEKGATFYFALPRKENLS
ncbi:MAG TPA: PAS domain S-box protein, partial [Anaerolineales bacterium]|nr:PAS domain S-box protein [Anaerolineales bacterium]